jgi:hypothetical protein
VGILGHLNRGGRFVIQRENIADDLWQASSLTFKFAGKLLLSKTINVSSTEVFSDFHRLPSELTFIQTPGTHEAPGILAGLKLGSLQHGSERNNVPKQKVNAEQ